MERAFRGHVGTSGYCLVVSIYAPPEPKVVGSKPPGAPLLSLPLKSSQGGIRRAGRRHSLPARMRARSERSQHLGRRAEGPAPGTVGALETEEPDSDGAKTSRARRFEALAGC